VGDKIKSIKSVGTLGPPPKVAQPERELNPTYVVPYEITRRRALKTHRQKTGREGKSQQSFDLRENDVLLVTLKAQK